MEIDQFNRELIGRRLREVRKKLHLTIEEAYRQTGFSRSLISEAENGLKKPSSRYLFALLDKFGVNINYILSGTGAAFVDQIVSSSEFGLERENIKDLFETMKHVDLVRYSMLKYYIEFKTANQEYIEKALSEKLNRR